MRVTRAGMSSARATALLGLLLVEAGSHAEGPAARDVGGEGVTDDEGLLGEKVRKARVTLAKLLEEEKE